MNKKQETVVEEYLKDRFIDPQMGIGYLTFWELMDFVYKLGRKQKLKEAKQ